MDAGRTHLYRMGTIAGLALGAGLALWRGAAGAPALDVLLWGVGGLAVALMLAAVADVGIRLQRRDLPPPP
jgi:hypothetical protein